MMGLVPEPDPIDFEWRGEFVNSEVNALHAEAFGTRVFTDAEWNWRSLVDRHSLGWVVARKGDILAGFVNVISDGLVHAWIQDLMVAASERNNKIGSRLVAAAKRGTKDAGCDWLHVDFEDHLRRFYFEACGFTPTNAGLIQL